MRIIFFGTGTFGIPALQRLIEGPHKLVAVVAQPDREKGRGWKVQLTPVKEFIRKAHPEMEVIQPEKASDPDFIKHLGTMNADLFVVIDYGQILSKELLDVPVKYCVNLHPSLLPKYRGPSPVNWAIMNGDKETGSTVIKMNERMDAGGVILQKKTALKGNETAGELLERLSYEGAELVVKTLGLIEEGAENIIEQDESRATYAPKLTKEMGRIDWNRPAQEIVRQVRAMHPWPGAFTYLDGKVLKVHEAELCDKDAKGLPGEISDTEKFIISTYEGRICIKVLQLEGKKAMSPGEFLRGYRIKDGTILG
jgi:methionyl-tRNA formyltransferase